MTRAAERPPATNHEDLDDYWEHIGGETPDGATAQALNLAHRAASKFPELANKYKAFAGPAAIVSGALMALAGVAIARRLRRGQQPEEALEALTQDEIERAATVSSRHNRWWRLVLRVAKRRRSNGETSS